MFSNKQTNDDRIAEYREAFDQLDEDGDGKITAADLKAMLKSVGQNPSDEDIQDMFKELDDDGCGTMDFEEFLAQIQTQATECNEDDVAKENFKTFDENGDGFITKSELRKALDKFGMKPSDEDINEMMANADTNKDGHIDFKEFVKITKGDKAAAVQPTTTPHAVTDKPVSVKPTAVEEGSAANFTQMPTDNHAARAA
ncbi:hypothetical protein FBU31_005239 [Coemansia sp. 'formosensis']|nr:hypothetical protein FBU31_005239 [Coemansia sp. 'formosensis']